METEEEKAIRILQRQLDEIKNLRPLNYHHPAWKAWRDTTMTVLEKFMGPSSQYLDTYRGLRFFGPARMVLGRDVPIDFVSREDAAAYQKACDASEETLKVAIRHIEDFGIYEDEEAPTMKFGKKRRGTNQSGVHYHGSVSIGNVAIAQDGSTQNIGHLGEVTGTSLSEIAHVFTQSDELTRREVKEGIVAIDTLNSEIQKPEPQRNWKSIFDYGQVVLTIADKATDLAHKLEPYKPAVAALVQSAKHALKLG